ncbi:MAG: hypothetical protein NY202_05625 [Mollicutes bacterium UO1]
MFQGEIKIFQIAEKKVNSDSSIEFSLRDKLSHPNIVINQTRSVNKDPFNKYQKGDHIGIDMSKLAKRSSSLPIYETSIIARLERPTIVHPHRKTFDD